jgi:hypothetical protein
VRTKKPKREPIFFIRPADDQTIDEIVDTIMALVQPHLEKRLRAPKKRRRRQ